MAFRGADCVKFLNLRNGLALYGERLFKPPQVRVKVCGILCVGCDGCDCSAGKDVLGKKCIQRQLVCQPRIAGLAHLSV